MRTDRVEVSWDGTKSKWLIRIVAGEEAVRRYSDVQKDVDEPTLRAAAQKITQEEGYESDPAEIVIRR